MSIELLPLVVPMEHPTALTVTGLTPGQAYTLRVRSCREDADLVDHEGTADRSGQIQVACACLVRGEHVLDVYTLPAVERLARLHFFAAPPELRARRPLRCDFHIHTAYSDGHNTPAEMLIRGRELGLDVAVITDHNDYAGSTEAVHECRRLDLNLITMPGEEVSGPDWHIVSINADAGIAGLAPQALGVELRQAWGYEALRWAVETTQAHGGHAYLAHPYWAVNRGYHLACSTYDRILAAGILDGLELLGDVRFPNNVRSLARYLDFRAAGNDIPIVGNSDTHRAQHTYGAYWTLAFARDPSPAGVLDAIAEGWSVACTTLVPVALSERSRTMQAFGTFEWVDYAYFVEEQFFPAHDALCLEEAALAYRAWRGERLGEGAMAGLASRMEALYGRAGLGL